MSDHEDCPACDGSGWGKMAEINTVPFWSLRHLRFWLIKKLARGDGIYLNLITDTPEGWALHKMDLDQGVLVTGVSLCTYDPWIAPPNTTIMRRVDQE